MLPVDLAYALAAAPCCSLAWWVAMIMSLRAPMAGKYFFCSWSSLSAFWLSLGWKKDLMRLPAAFAACATLWPNAFRRLGSICTCPAGAETVGALLSTCPCWTV